MTFNKYAFLAVISFYTYSQVFGLDSFIESNTTVQMVANNSIKYMGEQNEN